MGLLVNGCGWEVLVVAGGLLGIGWLFSWEQLLLEVFEANHDNSDVVKGSSVDGFSEDILDCKSTLVMDILGLFFGAFPDSFDCVSAWELIIDTITSKNNEVVVVGDLESFEFGDSNNNIWIATINGKLGFNISKGSGNLILKGGSD